MLSYWSTILYDWEPSVKKLESIFFIMNAFVRASRNTTLVKMLVLLALLHVSLVAGFLFRSTTKISPKLVQRSNRIFDSLSFPERRISVARQASSLSITDGSPSSTSFDSTFDWKMEWYPVIPEQDLNKDIPNKITLLGMDFCVWYHESSNQWRAFADVCPHRLVPLSEGRVESNGNLQCAYHGWEFSENGKCTRIPQLVDASLAAVHSPRACVTSFPICVEQGLVWIFPTPDESLTATKVLPLIPELNDPEMVDATNFFVRDMPYSWQVLVENLCDPSHVNFAHHSFMGGANRNNPDSLHQQMNIVVSNETSHGFFAKKVPSPENGRYNVKFQAPCLLFYTIQSPTSFLGLGQYCIPVAPNKSRIIARFPFRLPIKPAMFVIRHTPRWMTHFSQNIVMDSDVVFLTSQDELLTNLDKEKKNATKTYFMPTQCDAMVVAFQKWLSRYGPPEWIGIPAQSSSGEPLSWISPPTKSGRDALLDRYRQHTQVCSSCRHAHTNLYRLREVMTWAGVILLAGSVASPGVAKKRMAAIVGAMLLLAPRILLRPLIARLEGVPWPRKEWIRPTPSKILTASRGS